MSLRLWYVHNDEIETSYASKNISSTSTLEIPRHPLQVFQSAKTSSFPVRMRKYQRPPLSTVAPKKAAKIEKPKKKKGKGRAPADSRRDIPHPSSSTAHLLSTKSIPKQHANSKLVGGLEKVGGELVSPRGTKYWLMKSEPDVFSLDDLKVRKTEPWDGVRNYQARNHMKAMKIGDKVLFYHSNAKPSGVVGTAEVCKEAYDDHTAWKVGGKYFDAKASPQNPIWQMVDVKYGSHFKKIVSLDDCKKYNQLKEMVLLKSGRLSVQPVTKAEYDFVVKKGVGTIEEEEKKNESVVYIKESLGQEATALTF